MRILRPERGKSAVQVNIKAGIRPERRLLPTGVINADGRAAAQLHLRRLSPLPQGLEEVFKRYRDIIVVEMNDEGLYGYGQMASLLRARYANPAIRSLTKTDGLTFRVSEIVSGVTQRLTAAATA